MELSPFDAYPDASHEITHSKAGSTAGGGTDAGSLASGRQPSDREPPGSPDTPAGAMASRFPHSRVPQLRHDPARLQDSAPPVTSIGRSEVVQTLVQTLATALIECYRQPQISAMEGNIATLYRACIHGHMVYLLQALRD